MKRKAPARIRRYIDELRSKESGVGDTKQAIKQVNARYNFALERLPNKGTILDIGIGMGVGVSQTNSPEMFVGLDYNRKALGIAAQDNPRLRGKLVQATARKIPFKDIGAITAFELLEHLSPEAKHEFLREAHESLSKGGLLIISTPLSFGPVRTLNRFHAGKELELPQLRELLEKYFGEVEYYGIGTQPKSIGRKLAFRAQELVSSIDILNIRRKILPPKLRSIMLRKLRGNSEIKPLRNYNMSEGELPKNIIAVAKK
ncbi:MAG: class I SAM-dependent methyltransferase [Candidatus Diapherotrites archaeon]